MCSGKSPNRVKYGVSELYKQKWGLFNKLLQSHLKRPASRVNKCKVVTAAGNVPILVISSAAALEYIKHGPACAHFVFDRIDLKSAPIVFLAAAFLITTRHLLSVRSPWDLPFFRAHQKRKRTLFQCVNHILSHRSNGERRAELLLCVSSKQRPETFIAGHFLYMVNLWYLLHYIYIYIYFFLNGCENNGQSDSSGTQTHTKKEQDVLLAKTLGLIDI